MNRLPESHYLRIPPERWQRGFRPENGTNAHHSLRTHTKATVCEGCGTNLDHATKGHGRRKFCSNPLPLPCLALQAEERYQMRRSLQKVKDEGRRLFLSGEVTTNAEISARLKTKPHTIGKWRKEEHWDDLRLKIDRKAAEMLVDKLATDRVTLNVRHYRLWDLILTNLMEGLKDKIIDVREMERLSGILDRAQKGQRLAKGLSTTGETEEQIRAESEAEIKSLIDSFIDAVKENVPDEETRDKIRRALFAGLSSESDS